MDHNSVKDDFHAAEHDPKTYLVSGFSLAILKQIEQILDSSQEFHGDHRSFLLKNLASLRKEKDHWRNFMEKDERNMKTIWEVETELTKSYSKER
ncbi:hypothetical protein P5673_008514 [Acropora cervicornis]|uniref:Uncharacterized protein n=1 Tax=Acropora cervicornis TaxID=6130 RepID=A0AAD9VAU9_ACRCE|nr:hypothetical protein P5673_008514 [Acropora cervicornis]